MKTFILFFISFSTMASEGDAFTARLYQYEDMNAKLSNEVNHRMLEALMKANKKPHNCDKQIAINALKKAFLRPVVGVFEFWSSHTNQVSGHYVKYSDSIYKELSWKENLPVHLGKLGMATFFNINGTLVASDKFGHFFDEGYTYFDLVQNQHKNLEDALKKGVELEKGIYGLKRSKVFSHGDLVANKNGFDFWNNLFNDKNGNNYITCDESGNFHLNRKFDFKEYVDDGWDEGINCNIYADSNTEERVNKVIHQLEIKTGRNLSCPAEKEKCSSIIEKYQDIKEYVISPSCF